jgi:hypothetical protein
MDTENTQNERLRDISNHFETLLSILKSPPFLSVLLNKLCGLGGLSVPFPMRVFRRTRTLAAAFSPAPCFAPDTNKEVADSTAPSWGYRGHLVYHTCSATRR